MKYFIKIIILLCVYNLNAQSTYFDKYYKVGYNMQVTQNFVQTLDSNFIFYGISKDSVTGFSSCGLLKIDKYGNEKVKKTINYLNADFVWANKGFGNIVNISKSSILVFGGNFYGTNPVNLIISKINTSTLDTIKNTYYSDAYYYYPDCIIKLNSNKYLVYASKSTTITNNYYPHYFTVDSNANIIGSTVYNYTNNIAVYNAKLNPITKKVIMCGSITTGTNFFSGILQADTLGNVFNSYINTNGIHTGVSQVFYSTFDDTYVTVGAKYSSKQGSSNLYRWQICKYNATTLAPIWQKTYGQAQFFNSLYDAVINADGSIVTCGQYGDSAITNAAINCNASILKINTNGDSLWMKQFDHLNNTTSLSNNWFEGFYAIKKTPEGGYIMCGSPLQMPQSKAWVVSVDSVGCFNTSCAPYVSGLATNALNDNKIILYPNPTNDVLNITLSVMEASNYKIEITNTLGQAVKQEEVKQLHTTINVSNLPKGIYFIKIHSNDKLITTTKIIKQ